jgi:hypothetical protein
MSSIYKIEFKLGFGTDVNKQPTIHVMVGGKIDVYMNDGRVIKDLEIVWDDSPGLRVENGISLSGSWFKPNRKQVPLTNEEVSEIKSLLDDYKKGLWPAVEKFAEKIRKGLVKGKLYENSLIGVNTTEIEFNEEE